MGPLPPGDVRPGTPFPVSANLHGGQYDSFVLRIFSCGTGGGSLRGQVTHVATRDTLRFTNLERINHFILVHLGNEPSANPGHDSHEDSGPW